VKEALDFFRLVKKDAWNKLLEDLRDNLEFKVMSKQ
jgi:hypothetical protein